MKLPFQIHSGFAYCATSPSGEELRIAARMANWFLDRAERLYLVGHGWVKVGKDTWSPPLDYPYKKGKSTYRTGHAVNSQKYRQYNERRW